LLSRFREKTINFGLLRKSEFKVCRPILNKSKEEAPTIQNHQTRIPKKLKPETFEPETLPVCQLRAGKQQAILQILQYASLQPH